MIRKSEFHRYGLYLLHFFVYFVYFVIKSFPRTGSRAVRRRVVLEPLNITGVLRLDQPLYLLVLAFTRETATEALPVRLRTGIIHGTYWGRVIAAAGERSRPTTKLTPKMESLCPGQKPAQANADSTPTATIKPGTGDSLRHGSAGSADDSGRRGRSDVSPGFRPPVRVPLSELGGCRS